MPLLLAVGVVADLAVGDPVYAWHPVRLIGRTADLDGRAACEPPASTATAAASCCSSGWRRVVARRRDGGRSSLASAVSAIAGVARSRLSALQPAGARRSAASRVADRGGGPRRRPGRARAGRSARSSAATPIAWTARACRRAAVESLSENLTDGFVSPVFWYVLAGLPGLVLFKVVSTMDSMVGYKTPRYLRFGWCGARLDDVMNYLPARITWLVIAALAAVLPGILGSQGVDASAFGNTRLLLGPNSGWSEAATAGALQRRIVGPIWLKGVQVTDLWIGDASDPPLETAGDMTRAMMLVVSSGLVVAGRRQHRAACAGTGWTCFRRSSDLIRGASPLGLPYTRSRAPLRRRAPLAWLAHAARSHPGMTAGFYETACRRGSGRRPTSGRRTDRSGCPATTASCP